MTACTVLWCDATSHPADTILRHSTTAATFADGTVGIRLMWTERTDGKPYLTPHIQVIRAGVSPDEGMVDIVAPEAHVWAQVIAGVHPNEVLQLSAALLQAAQVIEAQGAEL